jgi:dihydrodipicolinate reductase
MPNYQFMHSSSSAIPGLPYPVYTVAMFNCVVTSTGFEKEEKAALQKKIERMGGIYANAFHDGVTHLVTKVG